MKKAIKKLNESLALKEIDEWGYPAIAVLRGKRSAIHGAMKNILDEAETEKRDIDEEESQAFSSGSEEISRIDVQIFSQNEKAESYPSAGARYGDVPHHAPTELLDPAVAALIGGANSTKPKATWTDSNGRPVFILSKNQRLVDLPQHAGRPADEYSFGHFLAALISPERRRHAPDAVRAALGEGNLAAGGALVPDKLSAAIIDRARAASVVFRAGAQIIPMDSQTLSLARVTTDPVFVVHGESEPITESAVAFDQISFVTRTVATFLKFSRELMADAANLVALIEDVVVRALAVELDRQFLVGAGGQEMMGIAITDGIGSTGSVGAIAWSDLLTALTGIESSNFTPNAYIASPTISGDLNALTSGDGATSAALWQGPPPGVDQLERFVTSNIGDAEIIMGDFSKLLVGLRQDVLVETTQEGGGSFENHDVYLKCTWRGDVALAQPLAFHRLSGITS